MRTIRVLVLVYPQRCVLLVDLRLLIVLLRLFDLTYNFKRNPLLLFT